MTSILVKLGLLKLRTINYLDKLAYCLFSPFIRVFEFISNRVENKRIKYNLTMSEEELMNRLALSIVKNMLRNRSKHYVICNPFSLCNLNLKEQYEFIRANLRLYSFSICGILNRLSWLECKDTKLVYWCKDTNTQFIRMPDVSEIEVRLEIKLIEQLEKLKVGYRYITLKEALTISTYSSVIFEQFFDRHVKYFDKITELANLKLLIIDLDK